MEDRFTKAAENQAFLVESIAGVETVKSMTAETRFQRQWEERLAEYVRSSFKTGHLANVTQQGIQLINKVLSLILLWLGAKLGASMKEAAGLIAGFTQVQIASLEQNGQYELALSNGHFTIELADVEITAEDIPGWSVASRGKLTVALDITLTDDLKLEGEAREFVNRIQNIRKENGFELTDRIFVELPEGSPLKPSIIKFNDYICREILADGIEWKNQIENGTPIEVNDIALNVVVNKKG